VCLLRGGKTIFSLLLSLQKRKKRASEIAVLCVCVCMYVCVFVFLCLYVFVCMFSYQLLKQMNNFHENRSKHTLVEDTKLHLSGSIKDGEPPEYAEKPDNWIFLRK
jgi:hypothetical protein